MSHQRWNRQQGNLATGRLSLMAACCFLAAVGLHDAPLGLSPTSSYSDRSTQQAEAYVCPMHSSVRSLHSGRCPICHMALEPIHTEHGVTVGAGAHHDHHPKHGGLLGMVGDYHIELVTRETEFRVYLYDAFTHFLSPDGMNATLTYEEPDASPTMPPTRLTLFPNRKHQYLFTVKPRGFTPVEATVELMVNGESLDVTFPLQTSSSHH